jgi:predicted Fe-Mo cluster-binding NifX family protein
MREEQPMSVCIPSFGPTLDSRVQPIFGRCAYFTFVDPDSMEFESVLNPNASASGEVGALSAQFVIDRGVTAVISAQVGPKAQEVLNAAGVKIMAVEGNTVREAVEAFRSHG